LVVVALIVGIIAGPLVANGFDPNSWQDSDEITKELTRCILAIQASKTFFFFSCFTLNDNRFDRLWLSVLIFPSTVTPNQPTIHKYLHAISILGIT
jgi:NhaP-type Na+/H+ or K+/H+ antiporter